MAKVNRENAAVNARIVYWGISGSGKTENLIRAHAKLRPDHRGEIHHVASRLDPSVTYEELPISLGVVGGVKTQIEMVAVPGGPEQGPMRKQLLDQVDGVVLVVDASASVDANVASFEELREALAAYGRSIEDLPLVVQYNKRDIADPYALDDLHRKLEPGGAPVFEGVATDGTGVLQSLSTVSKLVIRHLRESGEGLVPTPAAAAPAYTPTPNERMEEALLAEGAGATAPDLDITANDTAAMLDDTFSSYPGEIERSAGARLGPDMTIVSVGDATRAGERSVRIPLVVGDGSGQTSSLVLTIQLDALVDGDLG